MTDQNRSPYLPENFLIRMKEMLGEKEYEDFLKSYEKPRTFGLRLNTAKISPQEFEKAGSFSCDAHSVDKKRLFLSGRRQAFQMSVLSGRTLLPSGTKRNDSGFLS